MQYFVKHQRAAKPSPDRSDAPYITSDDFKRDHPAVTTEFVVALPGIFQREPVLRRGYQPWGTAPGGWRFQLHRGLKEYRDVDDLPGYVERVAELTTAANTITLPASPSISMPVPTPRPRFSVASAVAQYPQGLPTVTGAIIAPTVETVSEPKLYVNAALRTELAAKQGKTKLNVDKLLQLLRELDDNYADGHAYSCHTLLRAIIDHVPPVLGYKSFEVAVNNYGWTRTDKKYMTRLLDFKTQADDVLHRQIRESADVITMHDLPQAAALNALLRVCIDQL
ncbi:hypothetical protein [Streptomyces sp. NBC_00203]|uniref:hypothetical protein n=1 Tax=Streptomyces sp. NBC_00203 TaxID=2975680 RepID=UPI0032562194